MRREVLYEVFIQKKVKIRCFITIMALLLTIGNQAMAQATKKVSINVENVLIRTVLDQLQRDVQTHFVYDEASINPTQRISLKFENAPLSEVLNEFGKQTSLRYEIKRNLILITPGGSTTKNVKKQEPIEVTGTVLDDAGESIIGATVFIAENNTGTITDINGRFRVKVAPGQLMCFTFVGMADQTVKATPEMKNLKITMHPNQTALNEVVVTGYQTISKERATGAFAVVSQKEMKDKLQANLSDRLEGLVAGMVNYGDKVTIRGISTIRGGSEPLYVVDGMPFEGDIKSINPADVVNISVLKDASATSIYGARAANGVVVISTRRGGSDSKTSVSYNGSVRFKPVPDMDYLNLMNSSELVDMQIKGFNFYHAAAANLNRRQALNPVIALLYQRESGELTDAELANELSVYRNRDNRSQIREEAERVGIQHQHNLSISGGTEKNSYLASINYLGNNENNKFVDSNQLGFNFKDNVKFFRWLSADFGVNGVFTTDKGKMGMAQSTSKRIDPSYNNLYTGWPSYNMLRDENGDPMVWQRNKSDYELQRLVDAGLQEETFIPLNNTNEQGYEKKKNYYRIFAGLKLQLIDGLTAELKYQSEQSSSLSKINYSKRSWYVRNMVNEAAQIDPVTKKITFNVPVGGQLSETRGDMNAYTLRGQLNFDRTFGRHAIVALAGAEQRKVRTTATTGYYMGYDENSLGFKPVNPLVMSPIQGTESVGGSFNWVNGDYNYFSDIEKRYVSFYGNASYTLDEKYAFTASIRMDQSNLFGTDPKYQYRPLWSVGGSWYASQEEFMKDLTWLNRLNVRLTYGIGGNIPTDSGPYLTVEDYGYNTWVGDFSSYIGNPPNPQLRWEKTKTTNAGIDFSILNNRLSGSIDYYYKYTTDLLDTRNADPTLGWSSMMVNYGTMYNRGVEVSLNSENIRSKNFTWGTGVNFSYNKNKLVTLEGTAETVFGYTNGNIRAKGYPANSLFSYRWAGLDPKNGAPLVYNSKDEKVANVTSIDELVYSGTRTPKFSTSLSNHLSYKGFDLSFMFVYYGGHVMRDAVSPYLTGGPGSNIDRKALNIWEKPGDENRKGVAPAMNRNASYTKAQVWYAADCHILKADYIKLREVSLSYALPKQLIKRWNMDSVSLTCQINNLWKWAANDAGVDPEAMTTSGYGQGSRALPIPTTYSLGLSINL